MEVVIDIPEEIYEFVQNTSFVEDESTLFKQTNAERRKTLYLFDIIDAIRNGTPLPEHHGRLIDADDIRVIELEDSLHVIRHEKGDDVDVYTDAPTIIEGSDTK